MTKTFCDRCKEETTGLNVSYTIEAYDDEYEKSVGTRKLCPDCATALRAWLGEKK